MSVKKEYKIPLPCPYIKDGFYGQNGLNGRNGQNVFSNYQLPITKLDWHGSCKENSD
jgi:hypothetical protein